MFSGSELRRFSGIRVPDWEGIGWQAGAVKVRTRRRRRRRAKALPEVDSTSINNPCRRRCRLLRAASLLSLPP